MFSDKQREYLSNLEENGMRILGVRLEGLNVEFTFTNSQDEEMVISVAPDGSDKSIM